MSALPSILKALSAIKAGNNALSTLPDVGDVVSFEDEPHEVTRVDQFTNLGEEEHKLTLQKPEGQAVKHVTVDKSGDWTGVPEPTAVQAGMVRYMYNDPVDAEELKSLILRLAIANDEESETPAVIHFMLAAYLEIGPPPTMLEGPAAEKFYQAVYEKHGGDAQSYLWPEVLDDSRPGGWPKWLLATVAQASAEDDVSIRRHFQQMAVKGEK